MSEVIGTTDVLFKELATLLEGSTSAAQKNIDEAYAAGWRPPVDMTERFFTGIRSETQNPADWINTVFRQFSKEVTFPAYWTIIEKMALFAQLLGEANQAKTW